MRAATIAFVAATAFTANNRGIRLCDRFNMGLSLARIGHAGSGQCKAEACWSPKLENGVERVRYDARKDEKEEG
jgi:hypothetical protein